MPGLVKIGITGSDPGSRADRLYTTGVPVPFSVEFAGEVPNPRPVEQALHNAFRDRRVNPKANSSRLSRTSRSNCSDHSASPMLPPLSQRGPESSASESERSSRDRLGRRRPKLNFVEMGIPIGSELTFEGDGETTVTVTGERQVTLDGTPCSITAATARSKASITTFSRHRTGGTKADSSKRCTTRATRASEIDAMSDSGEKLSQSGQKLGLIGIGIHLNPQDEHDDAPYDHLLGFFEDIYLRFPSGSFALYGPNGVGKSRVLQAIKEALGGKGERQHRTDAFYRYSGENFRREASWYLQDRRQRWGAKPAPLPNDLADGIATDGLLCIRRGRGIRPQYAYSVAQDSLNPAVRQATSKLMAEIQRPFSDPDYMLEHFPDLVEEAGEWEMLVPEDGSFAEGPWVDRPDIRDLLRQMTWLSYVELSEEHGLTPQRVCSSNEPLIGKWDYFGRFIEIDRPAWAPWPLEWMLEPPLEALSDRDEPSVIDVDEITADPVEILWGMPFDEVEHTWTTGETHSHEQSARSLMRSLDGCLPTPRVFDRTSTDIGLLRALQSGRHLYGWSSTPTQTSLLRASII